MLDIAVTIAEPGYRAVCHVEWEAYAAATLVARMEDAALDQAPIWDDLRSFDSRAWRGVVDIIVAGYPCQPFSQSGHRRGASDERHLWPHVRRHAIAARVPTLFLENVEGHLRVGLDVVCRQLQSLGYIVEAGLFSAAEVGASHERARLFILAHNPCLAWELYTGQRRPVEGAADAGRRGLALADHHCIGRGAGNRGPERQCRADNRGYGPQMADHHRFGGGEIAIHQWQGQPLADNCGEELAGGCGKGLPYPQSEGHLGSAGGQPEAGRPVEQFRGSPLATDDGYEEPLFAPGPADDGAWMDILSHRPAALPAVCRAFDGVAHRVDRLRLAGNGVVPLAGAYAYRTLKARLSARLRASPSSLGTVR